MKLLTKNYFNMYFIETPNDYSKPEYFKAIVAKRYKNTPFALVKEAIGKMWTIYIIIDENRIVGYMQYYTKREAVKEIEEGRITKSINKELEVLKLVCNVLNNS